jgi:hypothetical protein
MIVVYATTKNGEGYVTKIGEYESVDEISIRIGTFAKDVLITIEEQTDEEEK